jgi:predicted RNase H-like HicB family nuclease
LYKYHINVFYSAEDKAFIADVPDLEGCSAWGKTAEAAVREVQTAIELWIDAARSMSKTVPGPRYRPAIYRMHADGVPSKKPAKRTSAKRSKARNVAA